jgi:hypothetical protein
MIVLTTEHVGDTREITALGMLRARQVSANFAALTLGLFRCTTAVLERPVIASSIICAPRSWYR